MIAHLLFEGSSTAYGKGDESGIGGYAGRFREHFDLSEPLEGPCKWVYVHQRGQLDNPLSTFVHYLPTHVSEARSVVPGYRGKVRFLAILAVGGFMDYEVRRDSRDFVIKSWRNALDLLEVECCYDGIEPIFLGLPRGDDTMRLRDGTVPDFALRDLLEEYTRRTATSLESPYYSFEEIIGGDVGTFMAADKRHPNAAGHERIFRFLSPLINEYLEIV